MGSASYPCPRPGRPPCPTVLRAGKSPWKAERLDAAPAGKVRKQRRTNAARRKPAQREAEAAEQRARQREEEPDQAQAESSVPKQRCGSSRSARPSWLGNFAPRSYCDAARETTSATHASGPHRQNRLRSKRATPLRRCEPVPSVRRVAATIVGAGEGVPFELLGVRGRSVVTYPVGSWRHPEDFSPGRDSRRQ